MSFLCESVPKYYERERLIANKIEDDRLNFSFFRLFQFSLSLSLSLSVSLSISLSLSLSFSLSQYNHNSKQHSEIYLSIEYIE